MSAKRCTFGRPHVWVCDLDPNRDYYTGWVTCHECNAHEYDCEPFADAE